MPRRRRNQEQTIEDFVREHGLTMKCTTVRTRPDGLMGEPGMSHHRCEITGPEGKMEIYFSQGSAFGGRDPEIDDVISSVARDCAGYANARSFEEWADEYGYSLDEEEDRAEAMKIYRAVERQCYLAEQMLGAPTLEVLMWEVEPE